MSSTRSAVHLITQPATFGSILFAGPTSQVSTTTTIGQWSLESRTLSAAIMLAAFVWWLCTWLGRMSARKRLHGQTVLLTNGGHPLTEALAVQLTDVYHCRVVMVRDRRQRRQQQQRSCRHRGHHLRMVYECDVLDGGELNGLLDRLRKEVGYVDVMIDNGLAMVEELVDEVGATAAVASGADVRQFIDATSQRIRATINLLITLVPMLVRSERGHYVTIHANQRDARPFLDSTSDIRRLLAHLQQQREPVANVAPPFGQFDIDSGELQLSTIVLLPKNADDGSGGGVGRVTHSKRDLSAVELAERIIGGIRTEQTLVELRERRTMFDYALDLFWG